MGKNQKMQCAWKRNEEEDEQEYLLSQALEVPLANGSNVPQQ